MHNHSSTIPSNFSSRLKKAASTSARGRIGVGSERKARRLSRGLSRVLLPLCLLGAGVAMAQQQDAALSAADQLSLPVEEVAAPININLAEAQALAAGLTGVGASRAEAIVRYREQFGHFESVEELAEVQGIGLSTVERNRARIRLH
ncbi:MAG: competence protein ComEA [Halieaceae bacterium]|jgi:competence protein ComEA